MTKEQREEILAKGCIPVEIEGKVIALQNKEESFKKFEEMYPGYEIVNMDKFYLLKNHGKGTPLCKTDLQDLSIIEDMERMFDHCESLESLDLSNFDTSKVKDMSGMFCCCYLLQTLDLSNFDTSNVKNMSYMFYGCTNLKTLNLSNFDTYKVESMASMFSDCKYLESLDLSNFDTSGVYTIHSMFKGCTNLKTLNLSNFDESKIERMANMFEDCESLKTVIINKEKNPWIIKELQKLEHKVEIIEPTQKLAQGGVSECHAFG